MTNNVWRPKLIDKTVVAKLEEWFSMWMTDVEACLYANISKNTLYRYVEDSPDFWNRKEELKNNLKMIAKTNLNKSITKWDLIDSKWYLERRAKDEFSLKQEIDQNTNMNVNMKIEEATDEELEQIISW